MSQYPPQDPNYPYQGGQPGPYGAPDPYGQPPQQPQTPYPQQSGGYGAPQAPDPYGQQPAYPGYPQMPQPQYPQPQYPQAPGQPYPGYGTPGQPSQYGAQAPQAPYGYPQGPGFPGGPGLPSAPTPSSNRGTITGIAIAAAVVIVVVVGVFVVRGLTSVSLAGQWYGVGHFSTTSLSFDTEIFMDLQQNGTTVSGSGKLCVNGGSGATANIPFTVSGNTTSSGASLQWGSSGSSNSSTVFGGNNLTIDTKLSGSQMALSENDPSGSLTASLQKGTEDQFSSACSQLTPITTG